MRSWITMLRLLAFKAHALPVWLFTLVEWSQGWSGDFRWNVLCDSFSNDCLVKQVLCLFTSTLKTCFNKTEDDVSEKNILIHLFHDEFYISCSHISKLRILKPLLVNEHYMFHIIRFWFRFYIPTGLTSCTLKLIPTSRLDFVES